MDKLRKQLPRAKCPFIMAEYRSLFWLPSPPVLGVPVEKGAGIQREVLLCFAMPAAKLKELSQQASALEKSADTESRGKLDKWLASATSQQSKQDEQHSNVKKLPSVEGLSANPFVQ